MACASGSDALLLALMALDIGPGDEVLVPSYTFFATASAVWRLGARPVFVDIEPNTYTLDPTLTLKAVGPKTKAVIPVHLYGQCAHMQALAPLAARGVTLIEDAAQSIGAEFHGTRCGSARAVGLLQLLPDQEPGRPGRRRLAHGSHERACRAAAVTPRPWHAPPLLPPRGRHQ